MWRGTGTLVFPTSLSDADRDTIAQIFVDTIGLESFENERLMFDKAVASGSNRTVRTPLTTTLVASLVAALSDVSSIEWSDDIGGGLLQTGATDWYIIPDG